MSHLNALLRAARPSARRTTAVAASFALALALAAAPAQDARPLGVAAPAPAPAPAPPRAARETAAELGKFLFETNDMSGDRKTSCATCHKPDKSFIDGKGDAEGQMHLGTGRNTPTLFGIGKIKLFRDPDQAADAKPGKAPKVMALDQRCLAPLGNELEMNKTVDAAVAQIAKDAGMAARFDTAFGGPGGGVTKERVGKALAEYVKSLDPPTAPYRAFLGGDAAALNAAEKKGLAIFEGRGRCNACHSGDALSDGLMHVVDPPRGQRIQDRQAAAIKRKVELIRREVAAKSAAELAKMTADAIAEEAKRRGSKLPGGGGYDADQLEVQTTTLWDVKRTAPYFRDGSIADLRETVATHVREMRDVSARDAEVKKTLATLDGFGKRAPAQLRPSQRVPAPEELAPAEIDDLTTFLGALSPR